MSSLDVRHEEFLRLDHYEQQISEFATGARKRLVVDFLELATFDQEYARLIQSSPETQIKTLQSAFSSRLHVLAPNYEHKLEALPIGFRNFPENVPLRKLHEHIGKLVAIRGIITRGTLASSLIIRAKHQCKKCHSLTYVELDANTSMIPHPSICPKCRSHVFTLLPTESDRVPVQTVTIQELPEDMASDKPPAIYNVRLLSDLVDILAIGAHVVFCVVPRLSVKQRRSGTSAYTSTWLDAWWLEDLGFEEKQELTDEDIQKFEEASRDVWLERRMITSICPSLYGMKDVKQAVLYQMLGGVDHYAPDGTYQRGFSNILIIADPACIVGDERVILSDGTYQRIQEFGERHLDPIDRSVRTGQGLTNATASTFFRYKDEPILEMVTESGKNIKGTYNQPILIWQPNERKAIWKRLDESRVGERVQVTSGIHCSKYGLVPSEWREVPQKHHTFRVHPPRYVTDELGGLLGYLLGDGWVSSDGRTVGFIVANDEADLVIPLKRMFLSIFGVSKFGVYARPPVTFYEVNRTAIAHWLSFLKEKRVPSIIARSRNSVVAHFLRWLFEADGTCFSASRGCGAIQLKSKEIELLRDVQLLLLRWGIHSRILWQTMPSTSEISGRIIRGGGAGNLVIRQGQSIIKFTDAIGFVGAKKRTKLHTMAEVAKCRKRFRAIKYERIVSIEPAGRATVYDIEVPTARRFVANGIVCHNTGKTTLLNYIASLVPRGRYTSAVSSSGKGLTALIGKDENGVMELRIGAVVMSNNSICGVDEIDKCRPDDRVALHECMESGKITIDKGGFNTQLHAHTAILAAGNPTLGRYDAYKNVTENINLPVTLLSRFDLIFILRDVPDKELDRKVIKRMLAARCGGSLVEEGHDYYERSFLRRYIMYARRFEPKLTDEAMQQIEDHYLTIREKSETEESPFMLAPRQGDALMRLAEARAKLHLRKEVLKEDVETVWMLMIRSLQQTGVDVETGKIDIDTIMTGKPTSKRNKMEIVLEMIVKLEKEDDAVEEQKLIGLLASDLTEQEVREILFTFTKDGMIFNPKSGFIKRVRL